MNTFPSLKNAAAITAIFSTFAAPGAALAIGGPIFATDDGKRGTSNPTAVIERQHHADQQKQQREEHIQRQLEQAEAKRQQVFNQQAEFYRKQQQEQAAQLEKERAHRSSPEYQQQMVRDQALRGSVVYDIALEGPRAAVKLGYSAAKVVAREYERERQLDQRHGTTRSQRSARADGRE